MTYRPIPVLIALCDLSQIKLADHCDLDAA